MSELKERTDALITQKSFSICGCPIKIIQDFKEFCQAETKNDYSMGIKILLERNTLNFWQEWIGIKIRELEEKIDSMNKKEEPKAKTFGKKVKDDVETE